MKWWIGEGNKEVKVGGLKATTKVFAKANPPTLIMAYFVSSIVPSFFTLSFFSKLMKGFLFSNNLPNEQIAVTVLQQVDKSEIFTVDSPLEGIDYQDYLSFLFKVLDSMLNLQICIFILINLTIYFIIMKKLSEIDWKLDWLNYWKLTNSLFLYFGLFSIWIFSNINIFFMQKVLESLNNFSS